MEVIDPIMPSLEGLKATIAIMTTGCWSSCNGFQGTMVLCSGIKPSFSWINDSSPVGDCPIAMPQSGESHLSCM